MKLLTSLSALFICLFSFTHIAAQETDEIKRVEIEVKDPIADRIVYTGQIQDGTSKDTIYLQTDKEYLVKIPRTRVVKMRTLSEDGEESTSSYRDDRPIPVYNEKEAYSFKEKGFYAALNPVLNIKSRSGFEVHAGAELVAGHRFSRMLGVGLGVYVGSYSWRLRPNTIGGVFAEARGFFLPKKVSPYYRAKIGYGTSIARETSFGLSDFDSADGGLLAGAGVGLRMLGNSKIQLNLETGWNFQHITYNNLTSGAEFREYKFHRHYIGFGIMF